MRRSRIFRVVALISVGAFAFFLAPRLYRLTPSDLLCWMPRQPLAAALLLVGLYAAKGLSFFFPLAVLEAVSGLLFPVWPALMLNLLGVSAATSLPYFLGRREQTGLDTLTARYPKLSRLRELRQHNDFLFVFLLRLTGVFPCDAVSVYLGAVGISYPVFLFAGLLGMLPHLVAATLLGSAFCDPPLFFATVGICAAITALSLTIWRICRRSDL